MLTAMVLCCLCQSPTLHPDEAAVVRGSQVDPDAVLQMSPEALQQQFNNYVPPPCDLEIEVVMDRVVSTPAGDVPCRFYHPDAETVLPLLIWFHGGGWVLGTLDQSDAICRLIAHRGQCAVLSVDYPLAPQYPFPAAVNTCEAVTRWSLDHCDELQVHRNQVAVGGASAGGNLAAVTAAALGDSLRAQFLIYPAVDALAETASRRDLARGYILHTDHMDWFYDAYVPDRSQWSDPRVSPLRANSHTHLPRTIVLTAQFDVLRDEAFQYALALSEAGVAVDLLMAPGMLHGFASRWPRSAVCRAELERAVDLLSDVLHGDRIDVADMLDLDQDGFIEPFEAADAVGLMLDEDETEGVPVDALQTAARLTAAWDRMEIEQMWADLNTNQDAWLDMSELPADLVPLAGELDHNQDGRLSQSEAMAVRSLEAPLFVHMEVAAIFAMYDTDRDDVITLVEAKRFGDAELVDEADGNGDQSVSRQELLDAFAHWEAPLWFEVDGNQAVAYGTIDSSTPSRVMQLLIEHPDVDTIVLQDVPGSVDDESNLRAARLIRHHGLATHVPADGEIASGGVDLFLSGTHRSIEPGARLGVHSWGGVGEAGDALDRNDEAHDLYLEYGREMGIPDAFYWFTIEAAPPDDIHWMTPEEIDQYQLVEPKTEFSPQVLEHSSEQSFGIEPIDPADIDLRGEGFIKETRVMAPNGKAIRIVAQAGVPDIAVARARNLLQFFLTDVPGTRYGADKSAVANAMADNGAMLMMPRGAHEPGHEP
ncbi:MAG: alpha/beta hydrolase fold domain-containing protein, partial [Phycisphaerales bacterium]|nr:alpha/beta hydrolase fold domain-containing protein [Phycisphaerales bacterium]